MLFITDNEFERVVSRARNRDIAREYYRRDYVVNVSITIDNRGYYHISGKVMINGNIYLPRVLVNPNSKIVSTDCNCIYADEYTACGHIGALILKVQELSPNTFPYRYAVDLEKRAQEEKKSAMRERLLWEQQMAEFRRMEREKETNALTDYIKTQLVNQFTPVDSAPVHLRIDYAHDWNFSISFKVGRNRDYILKNIPTFVTQMQNNEYHSYGKNLAFVHNPDILDEPSKKIYQFILKYYHTHLSYNNMIFIDPDNIDAFWELLKEIPATLYHFKCLEEELHPVVSVTKDKHDTILELETDLTPYYIGKKGLYKFDRDDFAFTCHSFDKQGVTVELLKRFDTFQRLYVAHEQLENFTRYIISPTKKYIEYVGLEDTIQEESHLEIYADVDEDEYALVNLIGTYEDGKHDLLKEDVPHSLKADLIISFLEKYNPDDMSGPMRFDTHRDETIDMIHDGLSHLNKLTDVYVSDDLQAIGTKKSMNLSVGIKVSHNLLEMDLDSLDVPKEELADIIASHKKKKRYHRLKNGQLLYIDTHELDELSQMMDQYHILPKDISEDGTIDLNLNRAYQMDLATQGFKHVTVNREESFKDVLDHLKNYSHQNHELNERYAPILRDYQKEGFQWLSTMNDLHFGGILADDMGLGKTIQIMSLLESNEHHFSIIICPASLILNWLDEFNKFSSHLKVTCVMGSAKERKEIIKNYKQFDVMITSYDYIRKDYEQYKDIVFDFIVLDEAQYIKNQKTKNAIAVKSLEGKQRFALTGTPIENSLAELWSIFDFLNKDYLYNYRYFKSHYEAPIVKDHNEEVQSQLQKMISPFVLRRTKNEVLKDLPDKIENTVLVDFREDEKKLYLAHLAQANKLLQTLDGSKDRIQILAMLTKLRQICCEPRIAFDDIKHKSSKMEACLNIIQTYKDNNKKIIVFSSFKSLLNLLADELDKNKTSYYMITGDTDKTDRKGLVDAYQNDDTTVFLISLKAGGTGLNLTAAEGVIHFDPWWNMSAQNQATDRAYRIGQKNKVFVYKLIMADSIEEKIQTLQAEKKDLADRFVEGNSGSITTMSGEEIMSLFSED